MSIAYRAVRALAGGHPGVNVFIGPGCDTSGAAQATAVGYLCYGHLRPW